MRARRRPKPVYYNQTFVIMLCTYSVLFVYSSTFLFYISMDTDLENENNATHHVSTSF